MTVGMQSYGDINAVLCRLFHHKRQCRAVFDVKVGEMPALNRFTVEQALLNERRLGGIAFRAYLELAAAGLPVCHFAEERAAERILRLCRAHFEDSHGRKDEICGHAAVIVVAGTPVGFVRRALAQSAADKVL